MGISFSLGANLKLGTAQKLTPQMQQAIRLLQMSSLELEQEVQLQLEKNPMLEREESNEDALDNADSLDELNSFDKPNNLEALNNLSSSKSKTTSTDTQASEQKNHDIQAHDNPVTEDCFEKLSDGSCDDSAVDTDWDNVYSSEPTPLSRNDNSELGDYTGNTTASIQDHVRWQMNFKKLSEVDSIIADYLIDSMNECGFITLDIDELHTSLSTIASFYQWEDSIDKAEIIAVLHMIQSCEPLGVGARDLSECLCLQLKQLDSDTPYLTAATKLLAHCHYLQSNNIKALLSETGLNIADIQPALELIRSLNPSPGQAYTDSQPDYLTPDSYDIPDVLVSIHYESDKGYKTYQDSKNMTWKVSLNPETLPKLRVNQEYASFIKSGDDSPDNQYLKTNLTEAKLFIRSIQERNQNLLKVATAIVKHQEQFFLQGAMAMQPLILRDIAEEVGLHESTVSRLTTSKTMLTPQGLFSLKHFFSSSVTGSDGEVSSTAICAMIEELITNENPKKPLSDNAIVKQLGDKGIAIARRTVAKYRDQLNIGSSTQRRVRY